MIIESGKIINMRYDRIIRLRNSIVRIVVIEQAVIGNNHSCPTLPFGITFRNTELTINVNAFRSPSRWIARR